MDTKVVGRTEYPWVARLREAGIDVRTGTGELAREPDASLGPPPGFRSALRRAVQFIREKWNGGVHRLPRSKRHAPVP
jgi:hypothetical protein